MKMIITCIVMVVATSVLLSGHAYGQIRPSFDRLPFTKKDLTKLPTPPAQQRPESPRLLPASMQSRIIQLVAGFRAENGRPPLARSRTLHGVAQNYAEIMAAKDQAGHQVDGKDGAARLAETGYQFSAWKENIGWQDDAANSDADSVSEQFRAWKGSQSGDRETMLSTEVTDIGIGVATNAKRHTFYCLLLAKP